MLGAQAAHRGRGGFQRPAPRHALVPAPDRGADLVAAAGGALHARLAGMLTTRPVPHVRVCACSQYGYRAHACTQRSSRGRRRKHALLAGRTGGSRRQDRWYGFLIVAAVVFTAPPRVRACANSRCGAHGRRRAVVVFTGLSRAFVPAPARGTSHGHRWDMLSMLDAQAAPANKLDYVCGEFSSWFVVFTTCAMRSCTRLLAVRLP